MPAVLVIVTGPVRKISPIPRPKQSVMRTHWSSGLAPMFRRRHQEIDLSFLGNSNQGGQIPEVGYASG